MTMTETFLLKEPRKMQNEEIRIEYENNHFGKPEIIKQYVRRGDIAGNSFDDNRTQVIATRLPTI